MKAVILAAGTGSRMGKYTRDIPKGMLIFDGKPLLEHQIDALHAIGVSDIAIVTGHKSEKITFANVSYFHNANFACTNMIESLMCACEFFTDDLIVSYADIVYTPELAKNLCSCADDIGVAVDCDWRKLWKLRYCSTEKDLETLSTDDELLVMEIGNETHSSIGLKYRYIGLLKFTKRGLDVACESYKRRNGLAWPQSGKDFRNGYMTDLLAEIISNGNKVRAVVSSGHWLEFDTVTDYEVISEARLSGKISSQYIVEI
ncbi:MAG: phosphocholine cytidylyltransferase family protein [Holosporales bacterium]|jgi:choline kinase|nr:phosphocholine cytidylyltransferase family protein [Holosporales bacterium]